MAIPLVLMFALAGCAGGEEPAAEPAAPAAGASEPVALIGLWRLEGTDEEAGTVLRIAPQRQLSLWRACGVLQGSWAAGDGRFVGEIGGSGQGCPVGDGVGPGAGPGWLRGAVGFGSVGAERVLLDRDGKTVARLLPGGKPKIPDGIDPSEAAAPVVTEEDRASLEAAVVPLPAGLTAADPGSLTGRWVPVSGTTTPFVEFNGDGTWRGSDGCNGNGGRWTSGTGGTLLATTGPSTLIACDGAPIAAWLGSTVRAGVGDGQLVLVDAAGAEVGRLRKG
jgi:heat shock protein HslJ